MNRATAMYCPDCEEIFEPGPGVCLKCGWGGIYPLRLILAPLEQAKDRLTSYPSKPVSRRWIATGDRVEEVEVVLG